MENLARTIILSGNRDKDAKAILSINEGGRGEIKFYNMRELPKSLAVGIRQKSKVSKFPLNICGGVGKFDLESKVRLDEPLFCAVVDVSNAFCPELVLCSSGEKGEDNKKIETAFVQGKPKDRSSLYEEQSQEEIEGLIDRNLSDDMSCHYYDTCGKCKYKQAFYAECDGETHISPSIENQQPKQINEKKYDNLQGEVFVAGEKNCDENTNQYNKGGSFLDGQKTLDAKPQINGQEGRFFEQIKPQIELLFSKYSHDENLENLVPNSKWVKVNYEGGNECYELGIICDEGGKAEYICYGILSRDEKNPPKSLEEYAKYLKLSSDEGLWVACQDANTGETIKLDFEK